MYSKMTSTNELRMSARIEPLTGENYRTWSFKVGCVLKARGLFKSVILGNEPPESEDKTGSKDREIWEKQNYEALEIIVLALSESQANLYIRETNARILWEKLERKHAGNLEDQKINAALELRRTKMKPNETMREYIDRVISMNEKCGSLGENISEREIGHILVNGLPPKYSLVSAALRNYRSSNLNDLTQRLEEEEQILLQSNFNQMEYAYKARNVKEKETRACYICKRIGHIARNCYYKDTMRDNKIPKQNNGQPRLFTNKWERDKGRSYNRSNIKAKIASNSNDHIALTARSTHDNLNNTHRERNQERSYFIPRQISDSMDETWNFDSGCTSTLNK